MKLPDEKIKSCQLQEVLHVPDLTYNLVSVSKASEAGKMTKFDKSGCHILNSKSKLIATATKFGRLYFLNYQMNEHACVITRKEDVWHRRYGHLGVQILKQLAASQLVDGFDYDSTKKIIFCDSCTEGKHHRSPFPVGGGSRAREPLDLVHTDVCGKLNTKSLGGAEYFLTFIDDHTRYVWIYFIKAKLRCSNGL